MNLQCRHNSIMTWGDHEGNRMWSCSDCNRRMYPACLVCIDVGHRNEAHPEPSDEENAWESFFPDWTKRHPFTCGECSWGRDGAYHDYEEYRIHMATRHKPQGEYCDEKEECDLQACPEHPHHDYNTNEHTWEQHHDRTEHCPPEETDLCKCDAYDGWSVDDLEKIERALGEIDKHPVLAGKDAYVKLSDVKDAIRKALGR